MSRKTAFFTCFSVLAAAFLAFAVQSADGKLEVKVDQEYYVCNCKGCDCYTISGKEGKCSCGNDLVKAKVTRVDGDTAYFMADGWEKERSFQTVGKYVCDCGPACTCNTISQKPGNCGCGKTLKKVGS